MYRIDTTSNVTPLPAYVALATPGYCQDTDPAGGTEIPAQWFNVVQEEICNLVTGLGGSLPGTGDTPTDDQLAGLIVPLLTDDGAWTTRIRVGDPLGTGYRTIIATEGGSVGPLFGYVQSDKFFASDGYYIGTQTVPGDPVIDSARDFNGRNVVCKSGGVDGVVLVASTGRVATIGDVYSMGAIKVGTSDLLGAGGTIILDGATGDLSATGDLDIGSGKFAVDGTTGDIDIAGKISEIRQDTATVAHNGDNDRVSGKVTLSGTSIASGSAAELTHFNDRVGTSSIVLWSFMASSEGSKLSQGQAGLSAGAVTFHIRNDSGGPFPATGTADLTVSYVVINPVG